MPLPQMTGDPGTMLSPDNPQGGSTPQGPPDAAAASPQSGAPQAAQQQQEQVRGAVMQLGQLKQQNTATLSAIAQQFPGLSKSAQEMQGAIDDAMGRLIKDLIRTVNTPEPSGPKVLR